MISLPKRISRYLLFMLLTHQEPYVELNEITIESLIKLKT